MTTSSHIPEITVYEPTVTGLPPLRRYWREMWNRRPFMWHLARTELKARHYDTVLGQVWILLDPILLAGVYFMLRSVVRPVGSAEERNYLIAHMIIGVCFYQYTARSLMMGSRSIVANQRMILNTAFPRAVFPVGAVLQSFLDLTPTILILFFVQVFLGQPFSLQLLWLPLVLGVLTVFCLGLAHLFGCLTVFVRDTAGFLPYVTQVWLYTTPVLYTIYEIPPAALPYLQLNPLFPFFAMFDSIFTGQPLSAVALFWAVVWAVSLFLVGTFSFLRKEREFALKF
jgi:teichoic acid transport system permease protein